MTDVTTDPRLAAAIRAAIDGKTKPLGALGRIEALAALCPITRIGRVDASGAVRLLDGDGRALSLGSKGFDHFQDQA